MKRLVATIAGVLLLATLGFAQDMHNSNNFQGPKANKGHVIHAIENGKSVLRLSDDFAVPDTPDPHWQVVDSNGNVYQLDKLKLKGTLGDRIQKQIIIPSYVPNVSK